MKRYSGLIFSALFPYVIVLAMFALFNDAIMINIFQSNAFLLIGSVLLWWGVSLISLLITMVIATQRKWDSCELAKVNMILKTAQIPAYVIIFLAGLLCMITVFTLPGTILLMLFDCLAIILSGIFAAYGAIRCYKEKSINKKQCIILAIGQFIFCVDVVCAIVLFIAAGRKKDVNKLRNAMD
ncbi:MAG: hypothetical protein IJ435_07355 [Clostridia bacterium]|nr:hypothetical protein [Clostridia bacterium]